MWARTFPPCCQEEVEMRAAFPPSPSPDSRAGRKLVLVVLLGVLAPALAIAQDASFYDEETFPELMLVFADDDWHTQLRDNYNKGIPVEADLIADGVIYPSVGVQYKGDASYTGKLRENTKITLDAFVPGQTFHGYDVITLDAGRQSSVFHEVAALWMINDLTHAPQANLAHLHMGTADTMLDLGVFTNTERVDGGFSSRHFGLSGHRYTLPDSGAWCTPFEFLGRKPRDYTRCYDVQGGDPATVFHDYASACIALHDAPYGSVRESLDPYLNVDAAMRHLICFRMVGGVDGLESGNNYYLLEEVVHGSRIVTVPWDLDLTWYWVQDPIPPDWFPLGKLFYDDEMVERAKAYVLHSLDPLLGKSFENRLRALRDLVIDAILGSKYEDYSSEAEVDARIDAILSTAREIRRTVRNDSRFNREVPALSDLLHSPVDPNESDEIWVTVNASVTTTSMDDVLLWSRVSGPFLSQPMFDDGAHEDGAAGDGVYGALLPPALAGDRIEYYVEARPLDLAMAGYGFLPLRTEFQPAFVEVGLTLGDIRIAEVVADNESLLADEVGDFDDFVVLANVGTTDVDVGGAFLSDHRHQPRRWQIPAPMPIPAGERLLIWCDDEPLDGFLHASFRLAKSGETLSLRGPDSSGALLWDRVEIPFLEADQSFARVPESGEHWYYVEDPAADDPFLDPGVARRYDGREDGSIHDVRLKVDGKRKEGEKVRFEVRDGLPHGLAFLLFGAGPAYVDLDALGILAVDLSQFLLLRVPLNATGDGDLELTIPDGLAGVDVYVQALSAGQDLTRASVFRIDG